jgi:hypothetical protein
MFGLGTPELIVLLLIALVFLAIPVAIFVIRILIYRKPRK